MCIILLAHQAHAEYVLVLAANRDEYYERPTAQAHFWPDAPEVLAGRDLERGGTWLGLTRSGRISAVTNYREPGAKMADALSRGALVSDYLRGGACADEYLSELVPRASLYNGFNLILGVPGRLRYFSNRKAGAQTIGPGVHGVSNHLLNTGWPKVSRGRRALKEILAGENLCIEELFKVLADDARAEDAMLPETGVGLELERVLSPLFVKAAVYGTRSSTVVVVNRRQEVVFVERTFSPASPGYEEVSYEFKIRSER